MKFDRRFRACLLNLIAVVAIYFTFTLLINSGGLNRYYRNILFSICINIIMAVSLNLTTGMLGELALGHAGFMAVGAFASAVITKSWAVSTAISFPVALIVGGLIAAVFGLVIGIPALRLKGDYLAIITLGFGEIIRVIITNLPITGAAKGLSGIPKLTNFNYVYIIMVLIIAAMFTLGRSRHGRAIISIRENAIAAESTGIAVFRYKVFAFTLAAFFAGVAGALYAHQQGSISAATFDYNKSIDYLVMVVLGGMGSINGSIIAAALITFLNLKLATVLTGNLAVLQNMVYALVLILIVIYNNAPALKGFREKYNLRRLIDRLFRHRKDPAFVREDEASWERIPTKIEMDELLSVDLRPGEYPEGEIPEKPDKKTDGKESR